MPAQFGMQANPGDLAMQVLVSGQYRADRDARWSVASSRIAGQGGQRQTLEVTPDPHEQSRVGGIAELGCGVQEGNVPGLIDPQDVLFDHPRVVLDGAISDDDITDPQPRVQAACHAGERDRAAAEPVGEHGGHHRGVDLAHPGQ